MTSSERVTGGGRRRGNEPVRPGFHLKCLKHFEHFIRAGGGRDLDALVRRAGGAEALRPTNILRFLKIKKNVEKL